MPIQANATASTVIHFFRSSLRPRKQVKRGFIARKLIVKNTSSTAAVRSQKRVRSPCDDFGSWLKDSGWPSPAPTTKPLSRRRMSGTSRSLSSPEGTFLGLNRNMTLPTASLNSRLVEFMFPLFSSFSMIHRSMSGGALRVAAKYLSQSGPGLLPDAFV